MRRLRIRVLLLLVHSLFLLTLKLLLLMASRFHFRGVQLLLNVDLLLLLRPKEQHHSLVLLEFLVVS